MGVLFKYERGEGVTFERKTVTSRYCGSKISRSHQPFWQRRPFAFSNDGRKVWATVLSCVIMHRNKGIHNNLSVFFFCPESLLPWQRDVTASPLYWEIWFCNRAVWLTSLWWRQTTPIFPRLRVLIRGDNERRALIVTCNIQNLITGKKTAFPVVQDAFSLKYWRLNTILIARASDVRKMDNTIHRINLFIIRPRAELRWKTI